MVTGTQVFCEGKLFKMRLSPSVTSFTLMILQLGDLIYTVDSLSSSLGYLSSLSRSDFAIHPPKPTPPSTPPSPGRSAQRSTESAVGEATALRSQERR